jgi:Cyclic nucleotide-binding domain/TLC ATP/ADP transporter
VIDMVQRLYGWLDIHEKEVSLFLWTMALLFLVRSSGIILNNYAETAFLKRYGVEFMPIATMINAVLTVVIMGLMAGLMQRFPGPELLAATFLFCGLSVYGLRLLIPLGIDAIYPTLFILKALYELLIAMLFWNLANDLFNTRQSKRLFPLISAGGVLGQILGSFGTPLMASWFMFDNLLTVYLAVSAAGAVMVWVMMNRFPALLMPRRTAEDGEKKGGSLLDEIKGIWPLMKESTLLRIMVVLTFMPNVVIPIMNYQFNYAIDSQFATESALIHFFGYFRGTLNIISLIILLFVGKIYGRWGLPVALMFHPFNYILAFMAFLFRFDVFSAGYARMTTNIIRTTINIPANAVIMGLFPESYRSMVRPFLRGTVVRIALFLGSGLILLSDGLFHPRYLSLVALPFVLTWLMAPFILKKKYVPILLDLVKKNLLDVKSMPEKELAQIFRDRKIQAQLVEAFDAADPKDAVWYAQLLQRSAPQGIDHHIFRRLKELPADRQIELVGLLSPGLEPEALPTLYGLATGGPVELTRAVLTAVNRLAARQAAGFDRLAFLDHHDTAVRALAAAGLYALAPETYTRVIDQWLASPDPDDQLAGVLAAGGSGNAVFAPALMSILHQTEIAPLIAASMDACHAVGLHSLNSVVGPFIAHRDSAVRQAALAAFHIKDRNDLQTVIHLLRDPDPAVRQTAAQRIATAAYQDGKTLIAALNEPDRHLREAIFDLIRQLQIKDIDLYRFARAHLEGAYKYLGEYQAVSRLEETPQRNLLMSYLDQQSRTLVANVLRVLDISDRSGQLGIIRQGLMSADPRQRANSQEALNDIIDRRLAGILLPLLDDDNRSQAILSVRKQMKLKEFGDDPASICTHLLERDDWLTILLTLAAVAARHTLPMDMSLLLKLCNHDNIHIRRLAVSIRLGKSGDGGNEEHAMTTELMLPDVLLNLKRIEIFEKLSPQDLAAIASATQERHFEAGQVVIREGEPGDTLYLVLEGEVAVIKTTADGGEIELDHIGAQDYFGEMALFEDIPRTATIRTLSPCRMLVLHKHAFNEIVREYPQIALEICKVLGSRIRRLHQKISPE